MHSHALGRLEQPRNLQVPADQLGPESFEAKVGGPASNRRQLQLVASVVASAASPEAQGPLAACNGLCVEL